REIAPTASRSRRARGARLRCADPCRGSRGMRLRLPRSAPIERARPPRFRAPLSESPQEEAIRGIARLVGVVVAEVAKESAEGAALALRHLQPDEHAPHVGAVVAVM